MRLPLRQYGTRGPIKIMGKNMCLCIGWGGSSVITLNILVLTELCGATKALLLQYMPHKMTCMKVTQCFNVSSYGKIILELGDLYNKSGILHKCVLLTFQMTIKKN